MDALTFFESDAIRLPLRRERKEDHDFEAFLNRVFTNYLAEFDKLDADDELTQLIKTSKQDAETACKYVQMAVHDYLCGSPHNAFLAFTYAIVGRHFDLLLPKSDQAHLDFFKSLFRIRAESLHQGVRGKEFGRMGLFHIPFQKREIVQTQRYSIPGLPCLYLGSTLYVCWEELGRPPLHSLYASAFRVRSPETITVLDFSETPQAVAKSKRQAGRNRKRYRQRGRMEGEFPLAHSLAHNRLFREISRDKLRLKRHNRKVKETARKSRNP